MNTLANTIVGWLYSRGQSWRKVIWECDFLVSRKRSIDHLAKRLSVVRELEDLEG